MVIHPISSLLVSLLTGLCLILLIFSPAHAFTGKNKIPPLAGDVSISPEEFESRTELMNVTPQNDPSLAFKIRLPKGWQPIETEGNSKQTGTDILRQVSAYVSPPRIEHRSLFRVSIIDVDSLILVDDWFIAYMLEMGFSIEGIQIKSPRLTNAQYVVFENGEPYVARASVTMSGSRIVLAEYLVHQEVYQAERDEQIWAMSKFSLVTPNTGIPIPMKTFNFVDIAKFDYPGNWTIQAPDIIDIKRMESSIINPTKASKKKDGLSSEMVGRIDVSIISKGQGLTLTDEINLLNESLKRKNYKLGKYIETIPVTGLHPLISSSRLDAYAVEGVSQRIAGYEYWVAVLQTKSRYYIIRLTTISRSENFKVWAENTETFKFLLTTLGPASIPKDDD